MPPMIQNNFRVRKNLRKDSTHHRGPQPHRHPEAVVRQVPAVGHVPQTSARRSASRPCSVACSRSRTSTGRASSCSWRTTSRSPKYDVDECRQRGMTFAAPIKVTTPARWSTTTREGGERIDPRHQGAGGLLRRDPADDRERYVHHQRYRARRRQPAAPQPGRLLRPRQGQDALERQAPLLGPHHPVPRLVARLRVRPQGHHLRPHRPPPQDARDRAAARARLQHARSCSTTSTDTETIFIEKGGKSSRSRSSSTSSPVSAPRATSRSAARSSSRRTRKFTSAGDEEAAGGEPRSPADRDAEELVGKVSAHDVDRRGDRRGHPRGATRRSPRITLDRLREAEHRRVQGPLHRRPQRRPRTCATR